MRVELAEQGPLLQAFFEALAPASRSPELREQLAGFYRETRADIAAQASESLPPTPEGGDAARVIASLLMAVFDGLQFQWFLEPAQTPSAAQIEQALGLLVATLAAGAAQPS